MLKIAKSKSVKDEKITIDSVNNEMLNISIEGSLENDNYFLDLYIENILEVLKDIPLYDKVSITTDYTSGSEFIINNKLINMSVINIIIVRYSDKYIFEISFNDYDHIYYGNCEIEIKVDELNKLL